MNSPLVSILIPTRNRAGLVTRALESASAQSYENIEIVVSDNWSSDNTQAVLATCEDPRVRVTRPPSSVSMTENWNYALTQARGEYFLLLSDDDFLATSGIEALLKPFLAANGKQIGACIGKVSVVADQDIVDYTKIGEPIEPALTTIIGFLNGARSNYPCGVMMRTSDAVAQGGYDGTLYGVGADGAMWMAVGSMRGHVAHVRDLVANYVAHSGSTTTATAIESWLQTSRTVTALAKKIAKDTHADPRPVERAGERHFSRLLVNLAIHHALSTRCPMCTMTKLLAMHKIRITSAYVLRQITRGYLRLTLHHLRRLLVIQTR